MDRYLSPPPTSCVAVCVWIPLFALRCEEARRPELASQPSALLAPDASRRVVWQVSPLARHAGVRPGMTVSQAIGLCPALRLCEPDPVHYDERFALLLAALARVSPVVEPGELGLAYVGTDGLEGLYGRPERQVEFVIRVLNAECGVRSAEFDVRPSMPHAALNTPHSAFRTPYFRVGWGQGKFVAWVAATRAKPGCAIIVHAGEEGKFLAAQPVAVLPLDPDAHRRLRQLGLRTLGRLAALPEEAIVSQFGRAGRRPRAPRADQRLPDLLHAGGGPGDARARARAVDRPRAAASAPHGVARAGGARAGRARARRLVARRGHAQGPLRGPRPHRRAAQDAPGADAARGRRGAARRRVHRLRPGHRRAAALRPGRGCRRAGRPTARPAERRPGDHAPAQTPHAASRHRGPAMVPSSGTPLRADRL